MAHITHSSWRRRDRPIAALGHACELDTYIHLDWRKLWAAIGRWLISSDGTDGSPHARDGQRRCASSPSAGEPWSHFHTDRPLVQTFIPDTNRRSRVSRRTHFAEANSLSLYFSLWAISPFKSEFIPLCPFNPQYHQHHRVAQQHYSRWPKPPLAIETSSQTISTIVQMNSRSSKVFTLDSYPSWTRPATSL